MSIFSHSQPQDNTPPADIPEPWATIIDERCAADARWFAAHPGRHEFTRPADPGEFWPHEVPDGAMVHVVQMWPGARVREIVEIVE